MSRVTHALMAGYQSISVIIVILFEPFYRLRIAGELCLRQMVRFVRVGLINLGFIFVRPVVTELFFGSWSSALGL